MPFVLTPNMEIDWKRRHFQLETVGDLGNFSVRETAPIFTKKQTGSRQHGWNLIVRKNNHEHNRKDCIKLRDVILSLF